MKVDGYLSFSIKAVIAQEDRPLSPKKSSEHYPLSSKMTVLLSPFGEIFILYANLCSRRAFILNETRYRYPSTFIQKDRLFFRLCIIQFSFLCSVHFLTLGLSIFVGRPLWVVWVGHFYISPSIFTPVQTKNILLYNNHISSHEIVVHAAK